MKEYTWEDVISSTEDPRAKEAIGKEVYFGMCLQEVLERANSEYPVPAKELKGVDDGFYSPFIIVNDGNWACIIVKKEPVMKRVPFDFNKKEDRDALRGRWIVSTDGSIESLVAFFGQSGGIWETDNEELSGDLFEGYVFLDGEDAGQPVGKLVEVEE